MEKGFIEKSDDDDADENKEEKAADTENAADTISEERAEAVDCDDNGISDESVSDE